MAGEEGASSASTQKDRVRDSDDGKSQLHPKSQMESATCQLQLGSCTSSYANQLHPGSLPEASQLDSETGMEISTTPETSQLQPGTTPETSQLQPGTTAETSQLQPGTTAETSQLQPGTTAETSQLQPDTTAETSQLQSGTTSETSQLQPGTTAETSQLQSGTTAETSQLQPGTTAETSQLQPGSTPETSQLQPGTTAETSQLQPGTTAETSQLQPGTTAETSQLQPGTTPETSQLQSGTTAETSQLQPGTTAETSQLQPGTTPETSQLQPGTTAETSQLQPGTTPETSQLQSGTTAETSQLQPGTTPETSQLQPGTTPETSQLQPGTTPETSQLQSGTTAETSQLQSGTTAETSQLQPSNTSGTSQLQLGTSLQPGTTSGTSQSHFSAQTSQIYSASSSGNLEGCATGPGASQGSEEDLESISQQYTTQFFGFTPRSLCNGIYNALNLFLVDSLESLSGFLSQQLKAKMTEESIKAGCDRIHRRVVKIMDRAFDKLERYMGENLMDVQQHVLLEEDQPHSSGDPTAEEEAVLERKMKHLTDRIYTLKYANCSLREELEVVQFSQSQVDAMLGNLSALRKTLNLSKVSDLKETLQFTLGELHKVQNLVGQTEHLSRQTQDEHNWNAVTTSGLAEIELMGRCFDNGVAECPMEIVSEKDSNN